VRSTHKLAAPVITGANSTSTGLEHEDADVIKELAFEANTKYIDESYRTGIMTSLVILSRICIKSLVNGKSESCDERWALPGTTLAFSTFKNERSAIEEHIQRCDVTWSHVQLDASRAIGLDFRAVLRAGLLRSPRFFYHLVSQYGFRALRRAAYPFLGYSMYRHLRKKFQTIVPRGTVVTSNTSHPISLAIHYAARAAGWQTIFLEHAMTPKLIAKDRGYSKVLLRSSHTKEMFVDHGIDRDTIEILNYWGPQLSPAPVDAAAIRCVGFAVNSLDNFEDTECLVGIFSKRGIQCEIRVHDADKRLARFRALGMKIGASISSAAGSDILEFIRRQDVVIVGNSGVLLDCLRAKVPAVYFWTGPSEIYDYYGLVTYMRLPSARSREELLRLLTPSSIAVTCGGAGSPQS
jgi:hypothetical protein